MTISLKHAFTSAKADGTDSTLIQPSNWNAEHTLTLATARLVGRTTAGAGAAEEITVGTNLTLSATNLSHSASGVTAGSYALPTITVDAQGHITGVSVLGYSPVNKAGDTMTGGLTATALVSTSTVQANGASAGIIWQDRTTNTNTWQWYSTGNVAYLYSGIAGAMGNKFTYDSAGNFTAAANITAYSDERVKTNWRTLDRGFLKNLTEIKAGIYDRTDDELTQVGVSAQDLQKILPTAVHEDQDGYLSVAYGNAALVAAVELAKEVQRLHTEIETLKARIGG